MGKWKTAILVIIIIWVISFLISNFFKGFSTSKIGNRIAVIQIYGPITLSQDNGFFELNSASANNILDALKKANEDPTIKGIILEINSPGGTVVASEEIANAVKKTKKPKVAWIREEGASGAYWIASSTDKIVADPLSVTGSIGVIGSYLEFAGLMEKYGLKYEQLTSGKYKDTGSPFKTLSDDEKTFLQNKINKIHDFFIDQVSKNRNIPRHKIEEIANGAFYLGIEAKDLGLIDILGGKDEAIGEVKKLANIKDAYLVTYQRKPSFLDFFSRIIAYSSFYVGQGFSYGTNDLINNNNIDFKT